MDWLNFRLSRRLLLSATEAEKLYATIAEIDSVKNSWRLTDRLQPQTIQRLTQSVIVTSTGASNRIEGNRLSDLEVEALYKKLNIRQFKTRDEQEVAGYLEMLELIFGSYPNIPFAESTILQLHRDMLRHSQKDSGHAGKYKYGSNQVNAKDQNGNIMAVIFDPTPAHLTSKEMQELLGWLDWALLEKFKHPLILLANFIFEFLAIHPFQDGNGRSSRLLTNLFLLQQGYEYAKVVSHEKLIEDRKADYYLALNKTQSSWKKENENIWPWLEFIFAIFKQQASQALQILQSDQTESLLSEKQLQLWQWAQGLPEPMFSRKMAVAVTGFPPRTVESIIKKLLDLKKIERLGAGQATRYRVLKS